MNRDGPLRFARRGRFSISVGALLSQQSSVVSFPLFVLSPSAVCPFCFHHFAGFFFVLFCVLIDEWNEATDFIFITRQTVNRRNIPREIQKNKTTDAMRNISKKNKMYVRLRRGRTR